MPNIPFCMILFQFKWMDNQFCMNIFQIKKKVIPFRITKKLILGIVLFFRQDRGVLNTSHMYLDF